MDKETQFLIDLVKTYSPSKQEENVSDFIIKFMKQEGFNKVYKDQSGNVVGEIGKGAKTILLAGHMDTVPGNLPVSIKDDKLYGRGSVDAKGSLASFIMAALVCKDLQNLKIVVIGTVEEELDGAGAHGFTKNYKEPIHYIVVGEPNHWDRINLGYKGSIYLEYELIKSITHTAHPEPTAIEEGLVFSNILRRMTKDFNEGKDKAFDQLNFSIRGINTSDDGVLESMKLKINFRTPVGFDFQDFKKFIEANRGSGTVQYHGQEEAIRCPKDNDLVGSFLRSIREHEGVPRFVVKTGTSDMNTLGMVYQGVPIVTYGPGDSSLDHTPGEYLALSEYRKSISVLASVLGFLDKR